MVGDMIRRSVMAVIVKVDIWSTKLLYVSTSIKIAVLAYCVNKLLQ